MYVMITYEQNDTSNAELYSTKFCSWWNKIKKKIFVLSSDKLQVLVTCTQEKQGTFQTDFIAPPELKQSLKEDK